MHRSSPPKKQPLPFGTNGQRENLLEDTPAGDNTASYSKGFPPVTMILKAAGGLPPKGQDMNQILFELSDLMRWASTGAINAFDPAFSSAISGYPSGALVLSDAGDKIFISVIDNNTDNPNSTNTGSWKNAADFIGVSESVQQDIDGKLAKEQNGADIPDKPLFRKNVGLVKQTNQFDATAGSIALNTAWGWGGSGYNQAWTAETFLTWARNAANGGRVFRNDTATPYSKRYGSGVFMRAGDTWSLISVGAIAGGPDVNGVRISSGNNSGSETQSYELWTNQNLPNPISASEFAGIPLPFPGAVAPSGFLKCNGQAFDKTTYPILAELYPSGHLPDLRGEFIRGWDDGRKVDTGRALLSSQGDAIRNITATRNGVAEWSDGEDMGAFSTVFKHEAQLAKGSGFCQWGSLTFDASKVVPTAAENRLRNIAFNYIVRAA